MMIEDSRETSIFVVTYMTNHCIQHKYISTNTRNAKRNETQIEPDESYNGG